MSGCKICPRECGANREKTVGLCSSGNKAAVALADLHYFEEPVISGTRGSGTVFFTGCVLKCCYCQNKIISSGEIHGKELEPRELSELFLKLASKGAHNINLVTPTQFIPQIARALELSKLPVPVVYNSGGYDKARSLKMLEGLVQIYLPDFKYAQNDLAAAFSGADNYRETAIEAICEMRRQVGENIVDESGLMKRGVIIRHMILPLHTKNSMEVLCLIDKHFKGVPVSLMAQYTPIDIKNEIYPELNRRITQRELDKVCGEMLRLEIPGFVQSREAATKDYIPNFKAGITPLPKNERN